MLLPYKNVNTHMPTCIQVCIYIHVYTPTVVLVSDTSFKGKKSLFLTPPPSFPFPFFCTLSPTPSSSNLPANIPQEKKVSKYYLYVIYVCI